MLDYENKRLGFKGSNIIDFTEYYNDWIEEKSIIKINDSNVVSIDLVNEKIIMIVGAIIGGIIILYVDRKSVV